MPTRDFEALLCVEGRWTGDDRMIMSEALHWEGILPMPLTVNHEGDIDAIVGRVDSIERRPGVTEGEHLIVGRGVFDLGAPEALAAVRQIEEGFLRGVSVELDALIVPEDPVDYVENPWEIVVNRARLRALSLVPVGAYAEAYITLENEPVSVEVPPVVREAIAAAAALLEIPDLPPADWFQQPDDVELHGSLTVTDQGRVYGLLAPAGIGHIGRADRLTAPMGNVDYSRFVRGETLVEGGRVPTGSITMECGHGSPTAAAAQVLDHYDNSCSLVATVAVGECEQGVWVAGALLPGVTADQVRRMMACQLSGHWLPTPTGYELMASLLVPVPGYAMGRTRASVTVADGVLVASAVPVVAAGHCGCSDSVTPTPTDSVLEQRLERLERDLAPAILAQLDERIAPAESH